MNQIDPRLANNAAEIKNLYGIADFYNFIREPNNVPSSHRHFQVFFYPEYNNYNGNTMVTANQNESDTNFTSTVYNNMNNLFSNGILRKLTLAIQAIGLNIDMGLNDQQFKINSPLGEYTSTGDGAYHDLKSKQITFTLLDQMVPIFETFFNKWLFIISQCQTETGYSFGYPFPRVNMAIKYYREDMVGTNDQNQWLCPNFIYYFRGVYPTSFKTCTINHSGESDQGVTRTVMFSFNTCWCLPSATYAKRYKLEYLFSSQKQLLEDIKNQQEQKQAAAELARAQQQKAALQRQKKALERDAKQKQALRQEAQERWKKTNQALHDAQGDLFNAKGKIEAQNPLAKKMYDIQRRKQKEIQEYKNNLGTKASKAILKGGAAVAGGIVGSFGGVTGAAVGGKLGYDAGTKLSDKYDEAAIKQIEAKYAAEQANLQKQAVQSGTFTKEQAASLRKDATQYRKNLREEQKQATIILHQAESDVKAAGIHQQNTIKMAQNSAKVSNEFNKTYDDKKQQAVQNISVAQQKQQENQEKINNRAAYKRQMRMDDYV